jgi:hypothetical protein
VRSLAQAEPRGDGFRYTGFRYTVEGGETSKGEGGIMRGVEPSNVERIERTDDMRPAAGAFTQVAGALGGFAITIMVLLLSNRDAAKDLLSDVTVAVLLLAGFGYIFSSSVFANSTTYRSNTTVNGVFNVGVSYFHVANMLLAFGLLLLLIRSTGLVSTIIGAVIFLRTTQVAVANLWRYLRR